MKKTIKDFKLKNKKVIIRVDFNVPIKNNKIIDDNRIKMSLPTIEYAIKEQAKVILMSHLGKINSEEDKTENSLKVVADRLINLLNKEVIFVNDTKGQELENKINELKNGEILLMENTRYEDFPNELESNNDEYLSKYWASLGDIFINDAFGTNHRKHASNVGIASNLPNGIGFLIEKELEEIKDAIDKPNRPFTVILGGSKVSDKIKLLENILPKADHVLIGGGMAYTFLKASGFNIGDSILDGNSIEFCKEMLEKYSNKIILPVDSINTLEIKKDSETFERFISDFKTGEIGVDIGHNTIKVFKQYLLDSKTIIWNGPVGMYEIDKYSNGTKRICEILKEIDAKKIVGGGDTGAAIINLGYKDAVSHISTGGGATLELLEGKNLPGIDVIDEKA